MSKRSRKKPSDADLGSEFDENDDASNGSPLFRSKIVEQIDFETGLKHDLTIC